MEQLNKNRSLMLLVLAILFLILFAVYMYLVHPAAGQITEQEARMEQLNKQRVLLQKKLDEKQARTDGYSDEAVQNALPLWDNTEQLLLDLQVIQEQSGAQTLSASFITNGTDDSLAGNVESSDAGGEQAAKDGGLDARTKRLKTTAIIKGDYAQVLDYVKALQQLKRLITINSLDILKTGDVGKPDAGVKVNLVFTAYFDPSYKPQVKEIILPFSN